jgi:hypothetical protein
MWDSAPQWTRATFLSGEQNRVNGKCVIAPQHMDVESYLLWGCVSYRRGSILLSASGQMSFPCRLLGCSRSLARGPSRRFGVRAGLSFQPVKDGRKAEQPLEFCVILVFCRIEIRRHKHPFHSLRGRLEFDGVYNMNNIPSMIKTRMDRSRRTNGYARQ